MSNSFLMSAVSKKDSQKAPQIPPRISKPTAFNSYNKPLPKRLIVCVDGTWGGPDGRHKNSNGNTSTVFRIFASVKEGTVTEKATGKQWNQQRQYFHGLCDKTNPVGNLVAGAFGVGLQEEIKKVYEYCCRHTNGPDDEIYFFGFSRGAFTVRAVANILCYMHVPKEMHDFYNYYQEMLDLYPSVRSWNRNKVGQAHFHFSRSETPPAVRFVGAFDTVKAFEDQGLFDVLPHPHIQHYRHALALNEERYEFKPETETHNIHATTSKHSVLQAWFIGSHQDLGGANSKDGLSLYPLQWVLSEAEALGLTLGFESIKPECREGMFTEMFPKFNMDNPIELVMPPKPKRNKTSNSQSETSLTLENGISVRLWDLCDVLDNRKGVYRVKLNSAYWGPVHKIVWTIRPRYIFDKDELVGYCPNAPMGTFIHPSVYQTLDENPSIREESDSWAFRKPLDLFRHRAIPDEGETFWEHPSSITKRRLEKIRILICGDAGVGKSSLVNKVLQGNHSQVNDTTHQTHNVEQEITGPNLPYIIHDSEGFQSGGSNKEANAVRNFLMNRSKEPRLPLRVHTIWYCILAGSERESRPECESDRDLFKVLKDCNSTIPVVVICTKVDQLKAMYMGELYAEWSDDQVTGMDRHSAIEKKVAERIDLFQTKIKNAFAKSSQGYQYMAGPIFTSQNKQHPESIENLVKLTYKNLTNDQVKAMFSQAQGLVIDIKVKEAIKESLRLYKHAVRTSVVPLSFSGCISTTVVAPMIVSAICTTFNFHGISGDIAWQCMTNVVVKNTTANAMQMFTRSLGFVGGIVAATGAGIVPGTAVVMGATLLSSPQTSRALLMCALDTILIMDHAFRQCDMDQKVEKKDIDRSVALFNKIHSSKVHDEIRDLIQIWNPFNVFDYKRLEEQMNSIVDRYRY